MKPAMDLPASLFIFFKKNPDEHELLTPILNRQRPRELFYHPTTMMTPDDSPAPSSMPSLHSNTLCPLSISLD